MPGRDSSTPSIAILGDSSQGGAYVLKIRLAKGAKVRFGRFQGGEPILLPAGDYVYVGSALAAGNSRSLARRLLRHGTRTGRKRSHGIRRALYARLEAVGLIGAGGNRPGDKRLRWHIDYLLDQYAAEITGVAITRTRVSLEQRIARKLAQDPNTEIVCKGLGASDDPGGTHLFRVGEGVWERLVANMA
jgi:Uri superfamily endonuclease